MQYILPENEDTRERRRMRQAIQERMRKEEIEIRNYENQLRTQDETEFRSDGTDRIRQIFVAIFIGFGSFVTSLHMGISILTIPVMIVKPQFVVEGLAAKATVIFMFFGAHLGAFASFFSVAFGWKLCFILSMFFNLTSWNTMGLAKSIFMINLARFIGGISLGLQTASAVGYVSETLGAKTLNRPGVRAIMAISSSSGFVISAYMAIRSISWTAFAWLGMVATLPQLAFIAAIPESPVFLYRNKNWKESLEVYNWLYANKNRAFLNFKKMRSNNQTGLELDVLELLLQCYARCRNSFAPNDLVKFLYWLQFTQQLSGGMMFMCFLTSYLDHFFNNAIMARASAFAVAIGYASLKSFVILLSVDNSHKELFKLSVRFVPPSLAALCTFYISKRLGVFAAYPIRDLFLIIMGAIFYLGVYSIGFGVVPDYVAIRNLYKLPPGMVCVFYVTRFLTATVISLGYVVLCALFNDLAYLLSLVWFLVIGSLFISNGSHLIETMLN